MSALWWFGACATGGDGGLLPAPEADLSGVEVVFVGEPAAFSAGASVGDVFTWDFGDGSSGSGAAAVHVYTAPGRYTARLTAADDEGRADVATATRVAVNRPLEEAPTASGRLAAATGRIFAVLPDDDVIVVVAGGVEVARWATCGQPTAVSARGSRLAVACRDDAVQLWDLDDDVLVAEHTFAWGARPEGVALDGDGAWVTLSGPGTLVHVDEAGVTEVAAVADPRGVAVAGGVVWAPRYRSAAGAGLVHRVTGSDVVEVGLAADPGPDSDTDARGVPNLLGAVAVRPDGAAVVVAGLKDNLDRGLRRDGLALTAETGVRAALRSIDTTSGAPLGRALFDNRDLVGALAFTPLGDTLVVAHLGAGMVDLLDPFTLTRLGGFQNVGTGLDGLAIDGDVLWVIASVDEVLVSFDLASSDPAPLARLELGTPDLGAQVFHGAADRRMSQDGYLSCASCHLDGATDAQTWDFSDRGEGFRDTQALFAMPDAGPFHWSANFDELQDFENAIRAHQGGTGFLADAALTDPLGAPKAGLSPELDAMAAFVRGFDAPRSPWREADGAWSEAAVRGRAVFFAAGCDVCHAGSAGSDAGWSADGSPVSHDVGTIVETSGGRAGGELTGLRTPPLLGLHATAPYLHDGRAPTLDAALEAHGEVADPDLVRYLLEIEGAVE